MADPVVWADRYAVYDEVATGGMATVYLAARIGAEDGGPRVVALKKLAPELVKQPDFVAMFFDEAHLAARIRHRNVVATYELLRTSEGLAIVMDFILGLSLSQLLRRAPSTPPLAVTAGIVAGALDGLHAAHEAVDDHGHSLGLVHRDVSPHNILVAKDGIARVIDFGIAKARGRLQTTDVGVLKGTFAYMAPEQIRGSPVDRRTDVYSAGLVFWEALTGESLFRPVANQELLTRRSEGKATIPPPSRLARATPGAVDAIVLRALEVAPDRRFATAREMADAIRAKTVVAHPDKIAAWLESVAGDDLRVLDEKRERVERSIASSRLQRASPRLPALSAVSGPSPLGALPLGGRRPRARPQPRAGRKNRWLLVAGMCAGTALTTTYLCGPETLKRRIVAVVAQRGLRLTVGHVEIGRGGLVLQDATVAFTACTEAWVTAAEIDVEVDWRGSVRRVSLRDFDVALHGNAGSVAACWHTSTFRRPLHGSAGHVVWPGVLTAGIDLEALDVSLESAGGDGAPLVLETPHLVVNGPRGHLGPWRAHVETGPTQTRLEIDLDPAAVEKPPSLVIMHRPIEGTELALEVPRGSTFKIGLPVELFPLPSAASVDASMHAQLRAGVIEAEGRVGLYDLPIVGASGAVATIDLAMTGRVEGTVGQPMPIQSGWLTMAGLRDALTGAVTLEPDGARVVIDRPPRVVGGPSPALPAFHFDTRDWTDPSGPHASPAP